MPGLTKLFSEDQQKITNFAAVTSNTTSFNASDSDKAKAYM